MSKHPAYLTWKNMRNRCNNKNADRYERYGGRGISICEEWNDFPTFAKWADENGFVKGLSLDRIDNNGNYEPGNCKWATPKEQANNTRQNRVVKYGNGTFTVSELAQLLNVSYTTLVNRLNYGWSEERLGLPARKYRK